MSDYPQIFEVFKGLQPELTARKFGYEERVNLLISEMLINIGRAFRENNSGQESSGFIPHEITRVVEAIKKCPEKQWTLRELAAQVKMPPKSFNSYFNIASGLTLKKYIITLRVEKAKSILSQNHKASITELAFDLGFFSSQHFSTIFKQYTGYSPSAFRKKSAE